MFPVGRQGGVVLMPMGPAWPLRDLQAGKVLTARNLKGAKADREGTQGWVLQRAGQCPAPFPHHTSIDTNLIGGWRVRGAL